MAKYYTNGCLSLSISYVVKRVRAAGGSTKGSFVWGTQEQGQASMSFECSLFRGKRQLKVMYSFPGTEDGESRRHFDYSIRITTTACHLGGFRYWFVCPLMSDGRACGRRASVLYMSGGRFGCRRCQDLVYPSQYEGRYGAFNAMFRYHSLYEKAEELEQKVRRYTYRGRPTKKQRRIERLYSEALACHELMWQLYFDEKRGSEKL